MFPDIMQDDVFRIETRRLWLRWPTLRDADEIATLIAPEPIGRKTLIIQTSDTGSSDKVVADWRAASEAGSALHLLLVPKAGQRRAVGAIHVVPSRDGSPELFYRLLPDHRGQGLMTEAVQAVLDAAFMVGHLAHISAASPVIDAAGRRVLERCGFTFVGTGLSTGVARVGLVASDQFCLDRKTWRSLSSWNAPSFGLSLASRTNAARGEERA